MSARGFGELGALAAAPEAVVLLAALLTQLGDSWFVFVALSLLYWRGPRRFVADPRRTGALLIALAVAALAVTVALKSLFALPRPPGAGTATPPAWLPAALEAGHRALVVSDGFGFPSGHALGATVVYGGAALLSDRPSARVRVPAAVAVVGLICLTRLVLGVHYAVDVAAGAAVGALLLLAVLRVSDGRPGRAFAAATGLGVLALLVAHPAARPEAAAAVGAGLGGSLAWYAGGPGGPRVPLRAVAVGLLASAGLWVGALATDPALPVVVAADAAAVALVVGLPLVVGAARKARGGGPPSLGSDDSGAGGASPIEASAGDDAAEKSGTAADAADASQNFSR